MVLRLWSLCLSQTGEGSPTHRGRKEIGKGEEYRQVISRGKRKEVQLIINPDVEKGLRRRATLEKTLRPGENYRRRGRRRTPYSLMGLFSVSRGGPTPSEKRGDPWCGGRL